jgi:tocopherol cyclase
MGRLRKIFHPEVFQGSLKKKKYFEGWYFKHVSQTGDKAFAVIPGVSLSDDSHSFVQFIDGTTGKTGYFRFPVNEFNYDPHKLDLQLGNSRFRKDSIQVNLENKELKIEGDIKYSCIVKLPTGILMPGIMGWYSYVPTMECNHGVVSVDHRLSGWLTVNGVEFNYDNGRGYIEKDWGKSFPESWIWMHCNNFERDNVSAMISVAKIPWRRSYFIGFISFISIDGVLKIFASYNGARILSLQRIGRTSELVIKKGDLIYTTRITGKGSGFLKAPLEGSMKNIIKESIDSDVFVELKEGGNILFSGNGIRAGFEETDKIFTYFNQ